MIYLKQLNVNDGNDIYIMLQGIEQNENEFTNPVKGMNMDEYKKWLTVMDNWSKGKELKEGYVPQTIYWLYDEETPVGIGKIRHKLTDSSKKFGGNIGYAISEKYRGKGYGSIFLNKLIQKANDLQIEEKVLTVEKYNIASKKIIEKNGGKLIEENDKRWIFEII